MASITKNPMVLQSANYVYNWFLSLPEENKKFLENAQLLDGINSDETILNSVKNNFLIEKERMNYDKRIEDLLKYLTGDSNEQQNKE